MSGVWTAKAAAVECGAEGHVIKAGQPVYEMGTPGNRRYRCQGHAPRAVDHAAVDAARHAIEAEDAARIANANINFKGGAPVIPGFTALGNAVGTHEKDLHDLLKRQGLKGVRRERVTPPRPPKPFAAIAGSLPASTDHD